MTVDYPPLSVEQLAAAGGLYAASHPLFEDSRWLNAAMKLPGLLAETAFVAVMLTWGRRRFGAAAASWTALLFWLSPGVILDGPVLGYLDPQTAVPAALALAAAFTAHAWLAGPLLAAAVLTKAQALFVAPAIAAALFWRPARDRVKCLVLAGAGAAVVGLAVCLPFLIRGAWPNILQAVGRLATHDMMSGNAANVWWIATWLLRVLDVAGEWGWWPAITQQVRIHGITRAVALGYPNPRVVDWSGGDCRGWPPGACSASDPGQCGSLTGWLACAYTQLALGSIGTICIWRSPSLQSQAARARYRAMFWWVSGIFATNLLLRRIGPRHAAVPRSWLDGR